MGPVVDTLRPSSLHPSPGGALPLWAGGEFCHATHPPTQAENLGHLPRRNLVDVRAPLKVPTRPNPPFQAVLRGNPENPGDEYVLSSTGS